MCVQHHDGDGHKNGMRGFHLKMYPESGVPEIEVISAEVYLKLHRKQNVPMTFLVRFGTME